MVLYKNNCFKGILKKMIDIALKLFNLRWWRTNGSKCSTSSHCYGVRPADAQPLNPLTGKVTLLIYSAVLCWEVLHPGFQMDVTSILANIFSDQWQQRSPTAAPSPSQSEVFTQPPVGSYGSCESRDPQGPKDRCIISRLVQNLNF